MKDFFGKMWDEMNRPLSQCATCNGTGLQKLGSTEIKCLVCNGTGKNPHFKEPEPEPNSLVMNCVLCNGTGKQLMGGFEIFCVSCNGTGKVSIPIDNQMPKIENIQVTWANNTCPDCQGAGWVYISAPSSTIIMQPQNKQTCAKCQGKGFL